MRAFTSGGRYHDVMYWSVGLALSFFIVVAIQLVFLASLDSEVARDILIGVVLTVGEPATVPTIWGALTR